jgi:hypothetical protein
VWVIVVWVIAAWIIAVWIFAAWIIAMWKPTPRLIPVNGLGGLSSQINHDEPHHHYNAGLEDIIIHMAKLRIKNTLILHTSI